jgi:DNA-binding PadR family transcriptional regulator
VKKLRRPDKTVYVTLKPLSARKLVAKDGEGRYAITDAGRNELERMRLIRTVEREDNPEIVSRLADLHFALVKARETLFP